MLFLLSADETELSELRFSQFDIAKTARRRPELALKLGNILAGFNGGRTGDCAHYGSPAEGFVGRFCGSGLAHGVALSGYLLIKYTRKSMEDQGYIPYKIQLYQ